MRKSVAIFLTTVFVLLVLLAVANQTGWTELESPPRQGEALDQSELVSGHAVHSETATHRLIREPQNTWSNLAFVAAGAVLLGHSAYRLSRLAGLALVAVGIGSFLYHASASRTFRNLDVGAMYSLFFILAVLALASVIRSFRSSADSKAILVGFAAACFGVVATLFRNVVILGFKPLGLSLATGIAAGLFCCALLIGVVRKPSARAIGSVAISLVLFAVAVVCQIGDRPGRWLCDPASFIQGHAAWHILAAGALFLGIRTMENQKPNKPVETTDTAARSPRLT